MKFIDKKESVEETEECKCEVKAFNAMQLNQLVIQMKEGDMLNQFLIFLGEGKDLFAKYGFITYDNKGLRYITISEEIVEEIEDFDITQDFDALLSRAFDEDDTNAMITFDVSFIANTSKQALQDTLVQYMNDYATVDNLSIGANEN